MLFGCSTIAGHELPEAIYQVDKPLTVEVMTARCHQWSKALRAVEVWREPNVNARYRLLAKANIGTSEFATTAGSLALRALTVPDAFCIERLKDAGCDIFGKTTMSELANFVTTSQPNTGYSHLGGFPVNPWHADWLPGGSCTGSAIAVAVGLCDAALGTETRGSLMDPAFANGVWAFKPTRGLISRSGIVPISRHFDTPGVLARDLETAVEVVNLMRGFDPEDSATWVSEQIDLTPTVPDQPLRVGLLTVEGQAATPEARQLLTDCVSPDVTLVEIVVPQVDFDYKRITSLDIQTDMDRFLRRYASGETPQSFDELFNFYRSHPETHPFGMDRLEDAVRFAPMAREAVDDWAQLQINAANALIRKTMKTHKVDALCALNFVDWWAIGGAPSIAIPMGPNAEGRPTGLMLGGTHGADGRLVGIAKAMMRE